jgi:hypothetical protein
VIDDRTRRIVYWVLTWGEGKAAELNGMTKMKLGDEYVEGVEIRVVGSYDQGTIFIANDLRALINLVPKRKGDSAPYAGHVLTFADVQDGMFQLEEVKLHMRV